MQRMAPGLEEMVVSQSRTVVHVSAKEEVPWDLHDLKIHDSSQKLGVTLNVSRFLPAMQRLPKCQNTATTMTSVH